jgi:DNA polymerase III alpha subunit
VATIGKSLRDYQRLTLHENKKPPAHFGCDRRPRPARSFPQHNSSFAMNTFNEAAYMSVFCRAHPLAVLRRELRAQGVVPSRQLRRTPSGRRVRVSGLLVIVHTPPTKSGKRVMFLTLEDETGLLDAVVFSKAQKDCAQVIYTSELLTLEGRLHRQSGNGLSISVVVDRVILPWSGKLSEFLPRPPDSGSDRNLQIL